MEAEKNHTTLAEIKELSNQKHTPSRNILKTFSCEGKLSHSHVKTICCQQAYSKRMSIGSALNRKETILKKNLRTSERKNNTVSKNMGKYNRLYFC